MGTWVVEELAHPITDQVGPALVDARGRDDTQEYTLGTGQTAGLINELKPAAQIVRERAGAAIEPQSTVGP